MARYGFWLALALLFGINVHAQVITTRPGADTMKVVNLINADRLSYKHPDSLTDLQILVGHVALQQDNTLFYCDSAVLNKKTRFIESFGNVHIIDNDTVHIRSQYLQYFLDTKMAYLKNNVTLNDNKSTLYTNDLTYDLNTKIGEYHNGGRLVNKQSVLTSKDGTYYEELKDVYFKRNVDLKDPQYTLKTDSLLYNTTTQIATFIAPTTIVDSLKRTIKTSDGFYDTQNRKAFFGKRPTLTDGAVKVIANSIESNDSTGTSLLRGNAVYIDTAQGVSVLANFIEANRDDGTFRATQHPLMIIKQDKDSIYITADTLYSGRLSKLPAFVPLENKPEKNTDTIKRAAIPGVPPSLPTKIAATQKPGPPPPKDFDSTQHSPLPVMVGNQLAKDTTKKAVPPPVVASNEPVSKADSIAKATDTLTRNKALAMNKAANKNNNAKPLAAGKPSKEAKAENKNDSTDRYFQAWHHVRIFSDSMQAVSDSLFYSGKDSVFRLFTNPVLWASNSQITGDTIYMFTKNKNPDRLYVYEHGYAINASDTTLHMFNQIKGNRINGYFKDGAINYMRAQGNGESIYYVKDDKNYLVGINNATADIIDMRFKNKELDKVVFISDVNGTLYPVRQAKEENKFLRSFQWLEDKRPKTKFELFEQ